MPNEPIILEALNQISQNLSDQPAGFSSFLLPIQTLIGPCFFSVSLLEANTDLRRIFSSEPERYPVDSVKNMAGTGWETAIMFEGKHLFSKDSKDLHYAFQDAPSILDLGFGCAINLRIALNGKLLGSVNLLAKPNAFCAESFHRAKALVGPLTLMTALHVVQRDNAS